MQSDKNIPPDVQIERDNVTIRCGERETVVTKDRVRIINTNFPNHGIVLECQFRPEKDYRQKSAEACCRFAAFLKRLRGLDRKKERYPENRG